MYKLSLIVAALVLSSLANAQNFTASVGFQLPVPEGEYKLNNDHVGYGGRLNVLWKPKTTMPLKLGLEFGYQVAGSSRQYFSAFVYGFYEEFKVTASNNVVSLAIMPRFQPGKFHKVKPFVDAIAGWNVFFSSVNVERVSRYSDYNNDSYGNSTKAHWAFMYGGAAGLDIPLDKRDEIGLELKCAYLFGADTKYLTNPQIDANGTAYFTARQSETNMLIPQIGIRLNITSR